MFNKKGSPILTSKYQCQAFLLYNDTYVDIEQSEIECKITGLKDYRIHWRTVIATTGFTFTIGFIVDLVNHIIEPTIVHADIGK